MNRDKRIFLFVSVTGLTLSILLLFGLYEIKSVKKHLEGLLKKEAEIIHDHLVREIDLIFGYLEVTRRMKLPIIKGLDDLVSYGDLAVEEISRRVVEAVEAGNENMPVKDFILLEDDGRVLKSGGKNLELEGLLKRFVLSKDKVFLKGGESSFVVGMKLERKKILFSIQKEDLHEMKKQIVLKDLLSRETERYRVMGINLYDPEGNPYIESLKAGKDHFALRRELGGKYMPNYILEIVLNRDLIDETISSVKTHLFASLAVFLAIALLGAYAIFTMERRVDKRTLELERELARKEKLISLGMLASGMAHEIRNPLNALILSLEKLKREIIEGKIPDEKTLDLVSSEIRRINNLVEEFLFLSRRDKRRERTNLKSLVEEVMTILSSQAEEKGITLENLIDPEFEIYAEKSKLKQALMNFILNSIEAIEGCGFVRVTAGKKGKWVKLSIEDNGKGIDEKDLGRVFDFHYTTKDKGVGLGLPISYMIIKDQGGDVSIESERGKGTKVTISLPQEGERIL